MFFSSPSMDLKITIFFLVVAFVVSLIAFLTAKRKLFAIVLFSVLANLVLFLAILTGSEIFYVYGIAWLSYFSFFAWPVINIFLIYRYIKTKK